jgi:hypothetical protein
MRAAGFTPVEAGQEGFVIDVGTAILSATGRPPAGTSGIDRECSVPRTSPLLVLRSESCNANVFRLTARPFVSVCFPRSFGPHMDCPTVPVPGNGTVGQSNRATGSTMSSRLDQPRRTRLFLKAVNATFCDACCVGNFPNTHSVRRHYGDPGHFYVHQVAHRPTASA